MIVCNEDAVRHLNKRGVAIAFRCVILEKIAHFWESTAVAVHCRLTDIPGIVKVSAIARGYGEDEGGALG
jgi:hypothetical protein